MSELHKEKFPAGAMIFTEGENPKVPCMYDILQGRVGVYVNYGKPNQKELVILDPDKDITFFGEMNLVDRTPRSATAVALEDCILNIITESDLRNYMEERPYFVLQLMQQMSGRLRAITKEYMTACRAAAHSEEKVPQLDTSISEVELYAGIVRPWYQQRQQIDGKDFASNEKAPALQELAAGEVIFHKGDLDHCLYEVLEGTVGIYADYGLPTQQKLTTLTPEKSRFFGELSLIDQMEHSATAVAETTSVVRVIGGGSLQRYFKEEPEMLLTLMRQVSNRTRELTNDYVEVCKALAENEKYEKNHAEKPLWLLERLNNFKDIWNRMSKFSV